MQDSPSSQTFRTVGLMSGSSLDGLDIACCDFTITNNSWSFAIPYAACVSYSPELVDRLRSAHTSSAVLLGQLHADFGHFCGQAVRNFVRESAIENVLLVGSHGHTIIHKPEQGFTVQIGDGAALAVESGLPVVCDFRTSDVARGGQGAPLVPMGDRLLFKDYRFLLNIGGISNVTVQKASDRPVAFDICSANQVLNFYAQKAGLEYDANGQLAASGRMDKKLFDQLNGLDYYQHAYPKSLDNGYSRDVIIPLMEQSSVATADKLHTFCEHIAYQIGRHIDEFKATADDKLLASGGGALNGHLISRIQHYTSARVIVADDKITNYKEALVFAFLGLLRWREQVNTLASVTGAKADSCGGAIYLS